MKLTEAKRKYKGQWLAFSVTKTNGERKVEGRVLAHDPDRRRLHARLRVRKVKDAYITYAGPPVKPGYAVIFLWI